MPFDLQQLRVLIGQEGVERIQTAIASGPACAGG